MHISHLTIDTGHTSRSAREDVRDDVLAVVAQWLDDAVSTAGNAVPLPVAALSHYSAKAFVDAGALVVTIYGPLGPHKHGKAATADAPIVTLAVAVRSRHAAILNGLTAAFNLPLRQTPTTPFCVVALHPGAAMHMAATDWIADFERCIAWAWVTRKPQLEQV